MKCGAKLCLDELTIIFTVLALGPTGRHADCEHIRDFTLAHSKGSASYELWLLYWLVEWSSGSCSTLSQIALAYGALIGEVVAYFSHMLLEALRSAMSLSEQGKIVRFPAETFHRTTLDKPAVPPLYLYRKGRTVAAVADMISFLYQRPPTFWAPGKPVTALGAGPRASTCESDVRCYLSRPGLENDSFSFR